MARRNNQKVVSTNIDTLLEDTLSSWTSADSISVNNSLSNATTTSGSYYTGQSINTNTTGSNSGLLWTTTTTPYYSFNYSPSDTSTILFSNMISYLKDDEVEKLLDTLLDRGIESGQFKSIVRNIVETRHMTEDFLLKYIDNLDKESIMRMHSADINSGNYKVLALKFQVEDK